MGITHSKQSNSSTSSGKLRTKSRKRSKLTGSLHRNKTKQQRALVSSPPSTFIEPIQQNNDAQTISFLRNDSVSPPNTTTTITTTAMMATTATEATEATVPQTHMNEDENDELLPLTSMRNKSTGLNINTSNDRRGGRRTTRNSSRTASRPVSTLSCSTDSGLQSATSSGWTFSGGLFSHIDTNTSSTITAITDYSTISKRSMTEWPDEYTNISNKKQTLPPPYYQQSDHHGTSSSTATGTTCSTTLNTTLQTTEPDLSLSLTGNQQAFLSTNSTVPRNAPSSLLDSLLTQLIQSPSSSFRLFKDAFTAAITSNNDIQETVFKAAEIWYQQTNDSTAQMWLARCKIEGWGTLSDPVVGFTRLKALADHGSWEAFYPLAVYYLNGVWNSSSDNGMVQPVDLSAAYQWFLATVESHQQQPDFPLTQDQQVIFDVISLAQYRLGSMLLHGQGVAENSEEALDRFEKSACLGNRYSQFITGFHYEKGIIAKQDLIKAQTYYKYSADQGFAEAQAALGICLIDQGETNQGIYWLNQAIGLNNTRALLKLGTLHETGSIVPKDQEKAIHYYKLAAHQDDPVAHYILGLQYRLGHGLLQQNYIQAGKHLIRSARAGFAPSQRLIGLMYAQGLMSITLQEEHHHQQRRKDEKTALVWFRRAASHGDVRALGLVGSCYEYGHGAAINLDIALQYYQKAARISSPFQTAAQVAVATLLHRMNRHRDALDWFLRAQNAKAQDIPLDIYDQAQRTATLMVARYRLHGWAGTKDPAMAFDMLSQLVSNNTTDGHAHYWLAACYEEGISGVCDCNLVKAFYHYQVAAMTGDVDAQFQVGFMLSNGKGVEKNRQEAFQWYQKAAQQGHKTALYSMGLYYVKGLDGVDKDLKVATDCFKKAAQLGLVTAMTSLASLYRIHLTSLNNKHDNEDDQDIADSSPSSSSYYRDQVIFWYRKAAALGDVNAQRELGILYNSGLLGITQDHAMAFDLLGKASRQEDAQATLLLASYYQHGTMVEKDDDQALQLYLYAASLGSSVAYFAAAQLYHSLHRYEQAFIQYQLASKDPQLQRTRIGRTAKLMVARYILSYIASSTTSFGQPTSHLQVTDLTINHTKEEAFKMLENLAVIDRFEHSFYWLADCYFTGNGTLVNYHDALYWFRRAADEIDNKDAMIKVAHMYENGLGSELDLSLALQYLRKAAVLGHVEGQHQMGMAFWRGHYNLQIDFNEAIHWFTKSATQCYSQSHWALGQLSIENGDEEMAIAWWQKAVDLGHIVSMRLLAALLLQQQQQQQQQQQSPSSSSSSSSIASTLDLGHILQLLADASRLGDTESLVLLGQIHQAGTVTTSFKHSNLDHQGQNQYTNDNMEYQTGSGSSTSIVNSDGEEEWIMDEEETQLLQRQQEEQELAIRCFEQAATMGHVGAMFLAGQSWHTQEQYAAAFDFYDQAAQHGHVISKVMRARYRLAGLGGIPIDKELGFMELLECAEKDQCVEAYNSLGQCYEMGLGTVKDITCAYHWYLRSSETTNDAEAMYRIGRMYDDKQLNTSDVDNSHEAAYRWYQLADQTSGHVLANYQLGLYYSRYNINNKTLAMKHFRKAAIEGNKDAMYELGYLYISDEDHDNKLEWQLEGVHWLTQAAQTGFKQAQCELAILYHSGRDYVQQESDSNNINETVTVVVEQDFEKAYDLFCQASRQGHVTATLYIGTYYEHGIHVAPSTDLAKEWYQEAIEQASSAENDKDSGTDKLWLAELGLARLWHQEKASIEAYNMFCAAYKHGPKKGLEKDEMTPGLSSSAMASCRVMIARYLLHGWGGVPQDTRLAAQELVSMADMGYTKVFLEVAQCYENGIGVTRDHLMAYTWYGRVIAIGNARIEQQQQQQQQEEENDIVDDDDLWDEQDEQDHVMALYRLAEMYRLGYTPDGQVDQEQAYSLYSLAANKGSLEAQHYVQSFSA
ncbi:uncharacterized protein BX664DRAFT_332716 [Halteromyces radiatus]|uniref:uncharacterized protein n=1 Tax=Halteromyces radiatus TaxID=101107 RepID=UPI0022206B24|nr:uncharacterized protein BX664DRAFT_332716 [Halteromyces radiatus]KAI8089318.1 hypothetical protein BX664DRAFT_332716 [Halteromyces radiatus]